MGRLAVIILYNVVALATFVKITFYDGYVYNGWNWLIAIPINIFLSEFWPLYWAIWRPLFGP